MPKVIKAVAVTKYPWGNFKGAKGVVTVQVKIDADGKVKSSNAVAGHPILKGIYEKSAKKWEFEASENKKSERTVNLKFIFTKAEKEDEEGIFFKPPYSVEMVNTQVR